MTRHHLLIAAIAGLALSRAAWAPAADKLWQTGTSNWSTSAAWNGGEPIAGDSAYINNGGTARLTASGETCSYLYLGAGAGNSGSVAMSSGGFNVLVDEYVGRYGTGTFVQTNGTAAIASALYLGYGAGASGTYELGGGQLSAALEFVGRDGTGTFMQTGGTNTVGYLSVNGSSRYELTGGALTVNDGILVRGVFDLGDAAVSANFKGVLNLGSATIVDPGSAALTVRPSSLLILPVGFDPGAEFGSFTNQGMIHYAGSALSVDFGKTIAGRGEIDDHVNGHGTISTTGWIHLNGGVNVSATGNVGLGSGALTVDDAVSGISSGKLAAGTEYVGRVGTGTFTHTGGTNTVASTLYLGHAAGSDGTYTLSSGQLTADYEYIGYQGTGTFAQASGTNTAAYLSINSASRYDLAAGILTITDGVLVKGTIDFGGHMVSVGMDGLLNLGQATIAGAGSATLFVGPDSLLILPVGFDPNAEFGSFTNQGLTHYAGSTFTLGAGESFTGRGEIEDHVSSAGTIVATDWIRLRGGLDISGDGDVDLGTGEVTVDDAVSGISGGRLAARTQYVGRAGTGVFTQTGGTNTVSDALYLGLGPGTDGTYTLSDGQLDTNYQYIGQQGTASFTQTGGINTTSTRLYVGYSSGSNGTYALSGDSELLAKNEAYVGVYGTGAVTQSGGKNTVTNSMLVGVYAGSSGTFALSGGENSAYHEYIGYGGQGTFAQTGGKNTIAHSLFVGVGSGSNGTFALSGDGQTSALHEYIGYGSAGLFTQTGGTHSVGGSLHLGYLAGSHGTYELGSGRLSSDIQYIGYQGEGTLTQTGGTNSVNTALRIGDTVGAEGTFLLSGDGLVYARNERIGHAGTGTFTQTGGTHTVNEVMYLGYWATGMGAYELGGNGQLLADEEHVGHAGTGIFTQTGGTNAVSSNLYLGFGSGADGLYALSGGQLAADTEWVGRDGMGLFVQTGGLNTAGYLSINSTGRYELTGGTLTVTEGALVRGVVDFAGAAASADWHGVLNLTGVTIAGAESAAVTVGPDSLLILPAGLDPNAEFGSFTNQGILHYAGSMLSLASGASIVGSGEIDDHVAAGGTMLATRWIHLHAGLNVSGSGNVDLGSGALTVDDPVSGIGGGQLAAAEQYVGHVGTGVFTQTGGSNTVGEALYLGHGAGTDGRYALSGSQLVADHEYVGYQGTGRFEQIGGTNTVNWALHLGYDADANGAYALSGNGQLAADRQYIGYQGTATFTQTGGTNTVDSELHIAYESGANGAYALSNGQLAVEREYVGRVGTGTLTQTGGTNTVDEVLYIGYRLGANGTYALSSGGTLSAPDERVGASGAGTFVQSGGTNTVSGSLDVGAWVGSSGTYALSDGQLWVGIESVGAGGTGSFIQTGGTNTVDGSLYVGRDASASGTYALSGAGQLSADYQYIGYRGAGTFTQTGGTNTVSELLLVGFLSGSVGTYELSGTGRLQGTTDVIVAQDRGQGLLRVTDMAAINTAGDLLIGQAGNGKGTFASVGSDATMEFGGDLILNASGSAAATLAWGSDSGGVSAVRIGGAVDLSDSMLVLSLADGSLFGAPTAEIAVLHDLLLVDNQGAGPVAGSLTFNDMAGGQQLLSEGTVLNDPAGLLGGVPYSITYQGGDGNDIVLRRAYLGDVNGDGTTDGLDVDPFVNVLLVGPYEVNADINGDRVVNGLDVDLFVDALLADGGLANAVPEPSAVLLLILGLLGLCVRPRVFRSRSGVA